MGPALGQPPQLRIPIGRFTNEAVVHADMWAHPSERTHWQVGPTCPPNTNSGLIWVKPFHGEEAKSPKEPRRINKKRTKKNKNAQRARRAAAILHLRRRRRSDGERVRIRRSGRRKPPPPSTGNPPPRRPSPPGAREARERKEGRDAEGDGWRGRSDRGGEGAHRVVGALHLRHLLLPHA